MRAVALRAHALDVVVVTELVTVHRRTEKTLLRDLGLLRGALAHHLVCLPPVLGVLELVSVRLDAVALRAGALLGQEASLGVAAGLLAARRQVSLARPVLVHADHPQPAGPPDGLLRAGLLCRRQQRQTDQQQGSHGDGAETVCSTRAGGAICVRATGWGDAKDNVLSKRSWPFLYPGGWAAAPRTRRVGIQQGTASFTHTAMM